MVKLLCLRDAPFGAIAKAMKPLHPAWNWVRLLLLGLFSYATVCEFGFDQPYFFGWETNQAETYPWAHGLFFSTLTAVTFLLCLDDPHQRRAAFTVFGLVALLTGPIYVWNAKHLLEIAPSSSWPVPHLHLGLIILCFVTSAGLFLWWLRRSIPVTRQGPMPILLFSGLTAVLLIMPWLANWCGIESLRVFTALPSNADAVRDNKEALTHLLVTGMAGTMADVVDFLLQWVGLGCSALIIVAVGLGAWAARNSRNANTDAFPFPSHVDLLPILLLLTGGLTFPTISSTLAAMLDNMNEMVDTLHRPVISHLAGLYGIEILSGLVFLTGSWLVLRRIRSAPQLCLGFSLLVLIASGLLAAWAIADAPHAMKTVGITAMLLCGIQAAIFFLPKRRAVWTSSRFVSPGETALAFAIRGSLIFALLTSAWMAVALELAFVSVMAIHYGIDWGNALKVPHGVAPTGEIAPAYASSLASIPLYLGPLFFATCLFLGVAAVLLFSICYSGIKGCAKLCHRMTASRRPITPASSDVVERHLGDAIG